MRVRTVVLEIGAASALTLAASAWAQEKEPADSAAIRAASALAASQLPSRGIRTTIVGAEVGYRDFTDKPPGPALAKLVEYREVSSGPVLMNALVGYTLADSITVFQATGRNIGQRDQMVRFRGNSPGVYDLQVRWDRIPHTFSTNARSLGFEQSPGVYVLPNPRPDTGTWNRTSPYLSPMRTMWSTARAAGAYTPSPKWDLRAEYTNIGKTGRRPMGMAFGSPGNNLREIGEPIDQTMHDVKLTESYASPRFQIVGMYDLSLFRNRYTSATSDNPLIAVDQATTGSSRGRSALAPSNQAHTGMVNVGVNLPARTRLTASGTYSLWLQDEQFIPITINSAINDPRFAELPRRLGGRSGTSTVYFSAVSRPWNPLTLSARVRTFGFRDRVSVDSVPVLVVNDRSLAAGEERERLPFTRRNADAGAAWRVTRRLPLTLSAGYGWERWTRSEARNVADLREQSPRVALDVGVLEWMSLRGSYTTATRRIHGEYVQNTPADLPLHRRFDQANRDRERTNLQATVTPFAPMTLSASWSVGHDEYPDSPYGLQSDRSNMKGADVAWTPAGPFSLDGSYTVERFLTRLRSKYRTTGQLDNPTYDWVANNHDVVRTVTAGFRAMLIRDRLEAGGRMDLSRSKFLMATYNPLTPTGGTATQNFNATASDLPEVRQKLQPMTIFATYLLTSEWGMTLRYETERWSQNDFRTSGLRPAEGNGIFLGNNLDDYNAGWVTFSLSYRPQLLRLPRPAL